MTEHEWLSLDGDEEVVWRGQPRVWRIAGRVAGAVVITLVAFAVAAVLSVEPPVDPGTLPVGVGTAVWGVAVLVALSQVASVTVAYLRVTHTDYVLTNRRVYRKTGIVSETVTNVGVDRVQNTTLHKDITGNLFDYGTVSVSTAGSGGSDLVVTDLDDPETFRDRLQEQVRAATESESESRPAPAASGLDDQTVDALLSEARGLRAVAERMEENV